MLLFSLTTTVLHITNFNIKSNHGLYITLNDRLHSKFISLKALKYYIDFWKLQILIYLLCKHNVTLTLLMLK